jgi:multidrug resistance efflux pump
MESLRWKRERERRKRGERVEKGKQIFPPAEGVKGESFGNTKERLKEKRLKRESFTGRGLFVRLAVAGAILGGGTGFLWGYQGQVKPANQWTIKSDVPGKVVAVNLNLEGKKGKNRVVIKLDTGDDKIKLKNLQTQLELLRRQINIQAQITNRKRELYNRIKNLQSKTFLDKSQRFFDYTSSENQLLSLKQKLAETSSNIALLKRTIGKKSISTPYYIVKIYPRVGEYVGVGSPLMEVAETDREKITIFVPIEKAPQLEGKKVYINGKPSNFKISKIWKVPDQNYITSYRVELTGAGLPIGKVVKVEFK